jgi:hypothetical protein
LRREISREKKFEKWVSQEKEFEKSDSREKKFEKGNFFLEKKYLRREISQINFSRKKV